MQRSSGSAEQPANDMELAEYMTGAGLPPPGIDEISSGRPAGYCDLYRLAFHNIGWIKASKKKRHTMENLGTEMCDMVRDKRADALGISEVFNLKDDHHEERQKIMEHLLSKLNSSAGQPATSVDSSAAQPAWMGRTDGHYIFVWNSHRLCLISYQYISCGIEEHAWRMAQYLRFRHTEAQSGPPLHICHCHSPSSDNGKLTDFRKIRIFKALWDCMLRNERCDAQVIDGLGSAVQPVTVFGGDFNCSALMWGQILGDAMSTQASRRSVQTCTSAKFPRHHGDRAIVLNAFAAQEDSRWGKHYPRAGKPEPFSDAHDVVLVPVCWRRCVSPSSSSAAQPACESVHRAAKSQLPSAAESSSSAAQPAVQPAPPKPINTKPIDAVAGSQVLTEAHTSNSAAQPASPSDRPKPISPGDVEAFSEESEEEVMPDPRDRDYGKVVAAPSLIIPSQQTPLYESFLRRLAATNDDGTLESLADFCIYDKLKFKQPYGSAAQPADQTDDPYELGLRMEHLLTVTHKQRSLHIERLGSKGDPRADSPDTLIFTGDDMAETLNTWRRHPETWSNATQGIGGKGRFNAMLFEIFGNRALVEMFIRFPMCSAEQPAPLLRSFAERWQTWRESDEAKRVVELSQRKEPGHVRLSKQINKLKDDERRGKWIAEWIQEDGSNWYRLSKRDQRLWKEFNEGRISDQIHELRHRQQQQPRTPGAAERIHASSTLSQTD